MHTWRYECVCIWHNCGVVCHSRWCHPWAGSPGLYKKVAWASQGKQASKCHSSMVPAWVLAWLPSINASQINPFLSELVMVFATAIEKTKLERCLQKKAFLFFSQYPKFWAHNDAIMPALFLLRPPPRASPTCRALTLMPLPVVLFSPSCSMCSTAFLIPSLKLSSCVHL